MRAYKEPSLPPKQSEVDQDCNARHSILKKKAPYPFCCRFSIQITIDFCTERRFRFTGLKFPNNFQFWYDWSISVEDFYCLIILFRLKICSIYDFCHLNIMICIAALQTWSTFPNQTARPNRSAQNRPKQTARPNRPVGWLAEPLKKNSENVFGFSARCEKNFRIAILQNRIVHRSWNENTEVDQTAKIRKILEE